MTHHPAAYIERARVLKRNGASQGAIAREMGVPRSTVQRWVPGRSEKRDPFYPPDYKNRARDMRRDGEKIVVIALELGIAPETARRWTRDIEIPRSLRNWKWVPRHLQSKNKNMISLGLPLEERKRRLLSGEYEFDRRFRTVLEREAARELRKLFDAPPPDIAEPEPEPEVVEICRTIPRPQSLSSGDPA